MCPLEYERLLREKFRVDEGVYEMRTEGREEVLHLLAQRWVEEGLDAICGWNGRARLPGCRIVPKNSDISRERPIINYNRFGGKRAGGWVARALAVIVRWMSRRWK